MSRPRLYPEISETKIFGLNDESIYPDTEVDYDENNWVWCSDDELGEAPEDPGTYESGDAKPIKGDYIPNKWCVRGCERCEMSDFGNPDMILKLRDFSKRISNL